MLVELFSDMGTKSVLSLMVVALGIMLTWFRSTKTSGHLPPSPGVRLPLLGHLYLLQANPRKQFMKWGEKYGPVFSLYFGSELMVVLHGYEVLKEALVKHADYFSNRPMTFVTQTMSRDRGFVTSGNRWKPQRKVSIEILGRLGLGTSIMEEKVQNEVSRFLDLAVAQDGRPFDPRDHIMQSISNIVSALIFGRGFRHDDPMIASCARRMGEHISLVEGTVALNFFPFLKYLPGDMFGLQKAMAIRDCLENQLIRKQIEMRKAAMSENGGEGREEKEDFLSGYMKAIEEEKKRGAHDTEITEENMVSVIYNMFAAGTETTSTTICWALLYLLHHPEVATKCFEEIESVVGVNRRPSFSDRARLVYMEATVMEVQRISSITPFALHHTVSDDIVFRGYHLPKGTIIMPSLDSALLSKDTWGDPQVFRPERFLDESEEKLVRREELIPYSIGRRSCLGEALAKMELLLFLSTFIQKFHFRAKDGEAVPPLKDRFGLSCCPLPYEICMVPR